MAQANGKVPTAHARARQAEKAANEAESVLAQGIGIAVATHLVQALFGAQQGPDGPAAPLLAQFAAQVSQGTSCLFCVLAAKKLIHDHGVTCQNAIKAGEPEPDLPPPPQIARAVTWVSVTQFLTGPAGPAPVSSTVPACWEHVQLPSQPPRQTGLVTADGRPVVTQG